jgi:hypothetical protein
MPLLPQRKGRRNATGHPPAYSLRVHQRVPPHRVGAAVTRLKRHETYYLVKASSFLALAAASLSGYLAMSCLSVFRAATDRFRPR